MKAQTKLYNAKYPCVLDTSVVINLLSTRCSDEIAIAIPNRLVVTSQVAAELENGRDKQEQQMTDWDKLVEKGIVEIASLDDEAFKVFGNLVIGSATDTLDDGEAATIACASVCNAYAIIDENKANRICSEYYPQLSLGCTGDILAHPAVLKKLGKQRLKEAILNALMQGRMQVPIDYREWIVRTIGAKQAAKCRSLPRSIRVNLVSN